MRTCIQNYAMPPKDRDFDNTVLSLRLTGAEAVRFWRVMDTAKSRNAYVGKSDIVRELLGVNPPTALTQGEITFFRTGEKPARGIAVASRSAKGIPLINHKDVKRRETDASQKKKNRRVA